MFIYLILPRPVNQVDNYRMQPSTFWLIFWVFFFLFGFFFFWGGGGGGHFKSTVRLPIKGPVLKILDEFHYLGVPKSAATYLKITGNDFIDVIHAPSKSTNCHHQMV